MSNSTVSVNNNNNVQQIDALNIYIGSSQKLICDIQCGVYPFLNANSITVHIDRVSSNVFFISFEPRNLQYNINNEDTIKRQHIKINLKKVYPDLLKLHGSFEHKKYKNGDIFVSNNYLEIEYDIDPKTSFEIIPRITVVANTI